jgi:hypothetical protein
MYRIRLSHISFCALLWVALLRCLHGNKKILPLCDLYGDTFGSWIRTEQINTAELKETVESHFSLGGYAEAMQFSQIWIPQDCSYHRFTNVSIIPIVNRALSDKKRKDGVFRIALIGDSASRGVFCGLTRILSGSELYGPCINAVCGTPATLAVTHKNANHIYDTDFGPNLRISFEYIFSFDNNHGDWALEFMIKSKPDVLIYNTGAWDFDKIARKHMNETAEVICDSEEMMKVSRHRSSDHIKNILKELRSYAVESGVRVIYRNNHYNNRFGALCADLNFEKIVKEMNWELWDNRRVSQDVWRNQTYDGFHFDRHKVHTVEHHMQIIQFNRERGVDIAGQLEIQLAQSLLNAVFHKQVKEIYAEFPNADLQHSTEN